MLLGGNRQPQDTLPRNLDWLAIVMAFMLALLGAPSVNELTRDIVLDVARASYPPGVVNTIKFLWMCACFPLVFFASRAVLLITMKLLTMRVSKGSR